MSQRLYPLLAVVTAVNLCLSPAALADYVAKRYEAENFSSRNIDWQILTPGSPGSDFVDPFHANASGESYMELQPDTRVNDQDQVIQGQNFWGGPGQGPALHYNVDIPEAGRYYVFAKAYSTGTEDNGIHVGVNSTTPASGNRMQWCDGKQNWTWSSAQRTDAQHCGVEKTIYLDFPNSGANTVTFWAREDGFELDQFILLKETHDGSLDCYPLASDSIRCDDSNGDPVSETYLPVSVIDNGNDIQAPADSDGQIDLALTINSELETTSPGASVPFTISVTNTDIAETATNVNVNLSFPDGIAFEDSDHCVLYEQSAQCSIGSITAGQSQSVSFSATTSTQAELFVYATLSTTEPDPRVSNNSSRASVISLAPEFAIDAALSLSANSNTTRNGVIFYTTRIENRGSETITNAQLVVPVPESAQVWLSDDEICQRQHSQCRIDIADIGTANSAEIEFRIQRSDSTSFVQSAELSLADDEQVENNVASFAVVVPARVISTAANNVISIEAEHFSSDGSSSLPAADGFGYPGWNLYNPNQNPSTAIAEASENGYLKLLPDTRLITADPIVSGISNFDTAGTGATLDYEVYIPAAGSYNVFARIRASNAQDAAVHIGLNNEWPASLNNVSVCTPDNSWQWASALGADCSGSQGSIDIPSAGLYTLQLSAATDGTAVDKIILSSDDSYTPNGSGAAVTPYSVQDADVELGMTLNKSSVDLNETATLNIAVSNIAATGNADALVLSIAGLDAGHAAAINGFDQCNNNDIVIECHIGMLAAGETRTGTLELQSELASEIHISASVSSLSNDTNSANDNATTTLQIGTGGSGSVSLHQTIILLLIILTTRFRRFVVATPVRSKGR